MLRGVLRWRFRSDHKMVNKITQSHTQTCMQNRRHLYTYPTSSSGFYSTNTATTSGTDTGSGSNTNELSQNVADSTTNNNKNTTTVKKNTTSHHHHHQHIKKKKPHIVVQQRRKQQHTHHHPQQHKKQQQQQQLQEYKQENKQQQQQPTQQKEQTTKLSLTQVLHQYKPHTQTSSETTTSDASEAPVSKASAAENITTHSTFERATTRKVHQRKLKAAPALFNQISAIRERKRQISLVEEQIQLKKLGIIFKVGEPVKYRDDLSSVEPSRLFKQLPDKASRARPVVDIFRNELKGVPEISLAHPDPLCKVESIFPQPAVEVLAHNLEKVVLEPGVHTLLDVDSYYNKYEKIYHFAPFLERIHQPGEVNFNNLAPFVTTSRDEDLHQMAKKSGCIFKASTSSISGPLTILYHTLSRYRPTHTNLLPSFKDYRTEFSGGMLRGKAFMLRRDINDMNIWSIDSYSGPSYIVAPNKILLDLGKSMEKMLVMEPERFEGSVLSHDTQVVHEKEAYNYMKQGKILIRSQLDCALRPESNPLDIPFVFDIKTRAINEVRQNMKFYENATDLHPTNIEGVTNSYEREFYDLVRSAFIKYSFQARIGSMNGMFMAYHNTASIFGFEYITLAEMDKYTFGGSTLAEGAFKWTTKLLESVCERLVLKHFSDESFKAIKVCMSSPYGLKDNVLFVFAEPMVEDKGWQEKNAVDESEEDYYHSLDPRQKRDFERKQLFDATKNEVFLFYLQVDVYVNGVYVNPHTDYLHYEEGDDVQVTYKWKYKSRSSEDFSLEETYISTLREVLFLEKM